MDGLTNVAILSLVARPAGYQIVEIDGDEMQTRPVFLGEVCDFDMAFGA